MHRDFPVYLVRSCKGVATTERRVEAEGCIDQNSQDNECSNVFQISACIHMYPHGVEIIALASDGIVSSSSHALEWRVRKNDLTAIMIKLLMHFSSFTTSKRGQCEKTITSAIKLALARGFPQKASRMMAKGIVPCSDQLL